MRVRTQIQLFIGTAFWIVLVMTIIFWFSHARLGDIAVVEERSLAAASKAASLQSLTHEYFLHSEERVAQQWLSQQKALADLLRERGPSHLSISPVSRFKVDELADLFQRLKLASSADSTSFKIRQKKFLAQQLLIANEIVLDGIKEWGSKTRKARISVERKFKTLTLAIPLFTLVILLLLGFLLNRRVLLPLQRLQRAVVAVSKGDLSLRSGYRRNDELGDLSRNFDAMAVDLVTELRKEIADRKRTEQILSESEARFRLLVENAPDAIFVQTGGRFAYLNNMAVKLFGASLPEELIGTPVLQRYHSDYGAMAQEGIVQIDDEQKPAPNLHRILLRMDGSSIDVEVSAVPMNYADEDGALVFVRDISDRLEEQAHRQQLEEKLNQALKIESIGLLAGGVAHDFNNMLGVIIGHAELAKSNTGPSTAMLSSLESIIAAAQRSADLTRQLLTFARKQVILPKVLDLNETVEEMLNMLQRLIGENIQLSWNPASNLWPVKVDPSQIDQILANLCVNARDAISGTGKITIKVTNSSIDESYCLSRPEVVPGDYVQLSFCDDGKGMDKELQAHVFEPFFTTKETGEGTGLGLATVYGAVKQNQGFITLYSEPGLGTAFNIYFPRVTAAVDAVPETAAKSLRLGTETVLLAEDDMMLLELKKSMLERCGYTVLPAATPGIALSLARHHTSPIHLLITDVIMPELNGKELTKMVVALRPGIRIIYMSGYTADIISQQGVIETGVHFLQKPFSFETLASKVRNVLDGCSPEGEPEGSISSDI